jgi:hypothetical protein
MVWNIYIHVFVRVRIMSVLGHVCLCDHVHVYIVLIQQGLLQQGNLLHLFSQKNQEITSKVTFIANKQISEVQPLGKLSTDKFQRLFRLNQWTKSMKGTCFQVSFRALLINDFKENVNLNNFSAMGRKSSNLN